MIKTNKKNYPIYPLLLVCLSQISAIFTIVSASPLTKATPVKYSIGSGLYYSKGTYPKNSREQNQQDKKITLSAIPLVFKMNRGLSSAKISTNYLYFTKQSNDEKAYQGFGNIYLSGKRLFPLSTIARFGDIQLKLKLPSAKTNSDLGSEGLDAYVTTSLYFQFKKNWIVTSLTYKYRRKKFNNTFSSSISYSHLINNTLNAGITFKFEQALQKSRQDIVENMLHLQWKQSKKTKIIFYYIQGHKDPVLQQAGGIQVNYTW